MKSKKIDLVLEKNEKILPKVEVLYRIFEIFYQVWKLTISMQLVGTLLV